VETFVAKETVEAETNDGAAAPSEFETYYRAILLQHLIHNDLPLMQLSGGDLAAPLAWIQEQASRLALAHSPLDPSAVKNLFLPTGPIADLANAAGDLQEQVAARLATIPAGETKTRDALAAVVKIEADGLSTGERIYEALPFLTETDRVPQIKRIVMEWKHAVHQHRQAVATRRVPPGSIFWTSRDNMAMFDLLARYRFRERYADGEFPAAFAAAEELVADALLGNLMGGEYGLLAHDLWLVSRSRDLPNRLADVIGAALRGLGTLQSDDGSWPPINVPLTPKTAAGVSIGDPYLTALCAVSIIAMAPTDPLRQRGRKAATWLLEQQSHDGGWRLRLPQDTVPTGPANVLTTVLALEALRRSGIPGIETSLEFGDEWLLSQQTSLGLWADDDFPELFVTAIVLEHFERSRVDTPALSEYLTMARGFLRRSVRLALEEDGIARQMALTTAFQGLESFLYGLLSLQQINVKIFEKANETIGLRKALTAFQEHLYQAGKLPRGDILPYRNELSRLAHLRDEIVHKGLAIAEADCRPLVNIACQFATRYSLEYLGIDLLASQ
jgi:hypothetical protein